MVAIHNGTQVGEDLRHEPVLQYNRSQVRIQAKRVLRLTRQHLKKYKNLCCQGWQGALCLRQHDDIGNWCENIHVGVRSICQ